MKKNLFANVIMFNNFKIRKGEKFIMVENGKPTYVVMSYEDYEGMLNRPGAAAGFAGEPAPNQPSPGQEFNAKLVMEGLNLPEDLSKIRLEDLPL